MKRQGHALSCPEETMMSHPTINPQKPTTQLTSSQDTGAVQTQTHRPILVSGSHRSGSTWVGKVLSLAPNTGYIHEPFNIQGCRDGICRAHFPHWFFYVTEDTASQYHQPLKDTLRWAYSLNAEIASIARPIDAARLVKDYSYFLRHRIRQSRTIMKDPIALFSAEWLHQTFDMDVVLIVRHPAAFVASLKVAGWTFPFADLQQQQALLKQELAEFEAEINEFAADPTQDIIAQGILLWRIFHAQIARLKDRHPDWIVSRHEDLSRAPDEAFGALYDRLGLDFSGISQVEFDKLVHARGSQKSTARTPNQTQVFRDSKSNIYSWKQRLNEAEIARIKQAVTDISAQFYSDRDW